MADTVDLGSTASAWGFESLQVHHMPPTAAFFDIILNFK